MATGFLFLLDDITNMLGDVAVLSKLAVKKTTGVIGDDLALNAHQVNGAAGLPLTLLLEVLLGFAYGALLCGLFWTAKSLRRHVANGPAKHKLP